MDELIRHHETLDLALTSAYTCNLDKFMNAGLRSLTHIEFCTIRKEIIDSELLSELWPRL